MMKKSIFYSLSVLLAFALVLTSCTKEDDYDFANYTPIIIGGVVGPTVGFASGLAPLTYSVVNRGGSTYNWTVSGIAATIVQNAEYPSVAYITFAQSNVDVVATITVTETAQGGNSSEPVTLTVNLKKFKPIAITGFNGAWTGEDAWYDAAVSIASNGATSLAVTGLSEGFIEDWWAETVISGGTFTMTVNLDNGTVAIARQYIYTTEYDGDPYTYEVAGTGLWDNTGVAPTLTLTYDIYYTGAAKGLAATYSPTYLPTPYMTATLTLDGVKRAFVTPTTLDLPAFKK